ncbi:MAG: hypothetical protein ACK47C_15070 [Paracoccaceae bacterium]|jgi:hypothetical protein
MTTIITRLYPDVATATSVSAALQSSGHDPSTIDVITRAGDGSVSDRMKAARVMAPSAAAYAPGIEKGGALLVVRAPFAPMGTARHAIKTVNRTPSLKVGLADEDVYIREQPTIARSGSVQSGTVFYMSNPHRNLSHGHIMGQNPISPSKPRTSAIAGGAYMSKMFWPMKLVSTGRQASSAISGGYLFSSMFGIPTLIGNLPSREMIPTKI